MEEIGERICELEIRFMHLAQQLDELNAELVQSNRRIDRLEGENRRLRDMLQTFAPDTPPSPDE